MALVEVNVSIERGNKIMKTLHVRNVNEALIEGIKLINTFADVTPSRNDNTLEIHEPVAITYMHPSEKVLINIKRDANPFFHIMESMWILAGRKDVAFLDVFNKQMVNYSDDGLVFNAPYGYRMREHFGLDQIAGVIQLLQHDKHTRQAVIQIWDPEDLNKHTKDKACNMQVVFRIRTDNVGTERLYMTVYNRSNDILWGALGANVVQFSMLQEYVAAHLGLWVGPYTQISNALHAYIDTRSPHTGKGAQLWEELCDSYLYDSSYNMHYQPYDEVNKIVLMTNEDIAKFDKDLTLFFNIFDMRGFDELNKMAVQTWHSRYFKDLVIPMLNVWFIHKKFGATEALGYIHNIVSDDWQRAAEHWLNKRIK